MLPERIVTPRGQTLWLDHKGAVKYATARHTLYATRQQVRQVLYQGQRVWHVRTAPPKVAEPCS